MANPLKHWPAPATAPRQPRPAIPDGLRVYAIGDIHGCADLLDQMAGLVDADLRLRPAASAQTVFLGDYVDRGPGSAEVIGRIAEGRFPTPVVPLRGNHEDLFMRFLAAELDWDYYAQLGGYATLQSYRLDPFELETLPADAAAAALHAAIPTAHRAFLEATQLSHVAGDYFFCHAGARPGVRLDRQSEQDLIWIREDFLDSPHDFGKVVVHGHTPVPRPVIRPNGINIDTKAYASGILTALVLEGTARRFLQTGV